MTPREINKSSIVEYLDKISIKPVRKMNGYYMYFSPIRAKEETPSFKVSTVANLWVDFGTNEGGTLIDLILKLNPDYTVSKIVTDFNNGIFSFHQPKQNERNVKVSSRIKIIKIEPLTNCLQACIYLKSRGIDFNMAIDYVSGISYDINNVLYKGIVSENLNGGYNICSKNFKCATKQGASFYSHNSGASLIVTEGIIDHLSFVMLYPEQVPLHDFCVLNSVNNLRGIYGLLKKYKRLICFLDNDNAGDRATYKIKEFAITNKTSFFDYRVKYKKFKDLNDYLKAIAI